MPITLYARCSLAMANSEVAKWSNGGDLFLDLSPERGRGLRTRIENAIRDEIRSGRLPRDTVLPATRTLARDLGVSRGTVMQRSEERRVGKECRTRRPP